MHILSFFSAIKFKNHIFISYKFAVLIYNIDHQSIVVVSIHQDYTLREVLYMMNALEMKFSLVLVSVSIIESQTIVHKKVQKKSFRSVRFLKQNLYKYVFSYCT